MQGHSHRGPCALYHVLYSELCGDCGCVSHWACFVALWQIYGVIRPKSSNSSSIPFTMKEESPILWTLIRCGAFVCCQRHPMLLSIPFKAQCGYAPDSMHSLIDILVDILPCYCLLALKSKMAVNNASALFTAALDFFLSICSAWLYAVKDKSTLLYGSDYLLGNRHKISFTLCLEIAFIPLSLTGSIKHDGTANTDRTGIFGTDTSFYSIATRITDNWYNSVIFITWRYRSAV